MAIYGVAQTIPDRRIVGDITRAFLDSMYYTPVQDSIKTNGKWSRQAIVQSAFISIRITSGH